ncbi:methyltransferase domain-containing protein [Pikeienuella piscinae]|uniref:Ribosomal protein L11 methyltransferase n=1 Tax=Pikeienuella piscinae TaxID=2748098 RepID=A0A7L5BZL9_9RHOB|nr:50S ribosomal protein L11 methyltransferase [Pikeienuella piscinae]QIE55314.1 methyltransferase domain-containing protein [Pikeienuella piscinae]
MTTYSAITTLKGVAAAEAMTVAAEGMDPAPYGVGYLEIEDGSGLFEVAAYFTERPDPGQLALCAAAFGARAFTLSEIGERDWVSEVQRELTPVVAGRFLVHGSHDRGAAKRARHPLEIEAAMAFGTGHHGTTRGCLMALHLLAKSGFRPRRIADIGAGTAVLAMAAASVWKRRCLASDIDEVAVATARANARANRLGPLIATARAAGFAAPRVRADAPYDLILANILANPLKRMAGAMRAHLAPGGVIVLSGILNEQRAGVEAVYRAHGFARIRIGRDGDWSTLVLQG